MKVKVPEIEYFLWVFSLQKVIIERLIISDTSEQMFAGCSDQLHHDHLHVDHLAPPLPPLLTLPLSSKGDSLNL